MARWYHLGMRRFATAVLALALCATFSFADYHHHVDDGQQSDSCSACALASLDCCPAPQTVACDPPALEHEEGPEENSRRKPSTATGRLAPRAPPVPC